MPIAADYLAGRLLLAMPGMGDPRFDRSVVALLAHNAEGAFGLCVHAVLAGVRFRDLLADLDIDPGTAPDAPVHAGGPVEPERGFVLHSPDWQGEGTLAVPHLGAMTASLDVLRAIAEGRGPRRWLIALGYAGWGDGQLDGEMRGHGWYAAGGHAAVLWDHPAPDRWTAAWRAEGIDPALLARQTGRA